MKTDKKSNPWFRAISALVALAFVVFLMWFVVYVVSATTEIIHQHVLAFPVFNWTDTSYLVLSATVLFFFASAGWHIAKKGFIRK